MSRIQQVLDKAEREGRMRRTTAPLDRPAPATPPQPPAVPRDVTGRAAPMPQAARPAVAAVPNPVVVPHRPVDAPLHPLLVAAVAPRSPFAEQYRTLRTRLGQIENGSEYRALVITSPTKGDGKTLTSLNLALAMAQEHHRRVVLVDADLRGGSLHRLLGIPAEPGLSDVLGGTCALEDAMVTLARQRLVVIPAGSAVDEPAELLGSAEMRRVVDVLRTQFDRVVFDTPPASPLADVAVLAPLADGVLMVVRAGRTQRPALDRAIADLEGSRLVGLVLNDIEGDPAAYGYAYRAGEGAASAGVRRPAFSSGDARSR